MRLTISLLLVALCIGLVNGQPVIDADIDLKSSMDYRPEDFGHTATDAISIDIIDSIESSNKHDDKPDYDVIGAKLNLGNMLQDLGEIFTNEAIEASRDFAREFPESFSDKVATTLPSELRVGHIRLQGDPKIAENQAMLLDIFSDPEKLRSLLKQVAKPDVDREMIAILVPLSKDAAQMLIGDLKIAVNAASNSISDDKLSSQWLPQLKDSARIILRRDSGFILNKIQDKLEEKIPDFIIDSLGDALGAGIFTRLLIRNLLGDTIKKEVSQDLSILSNVIVSRFGNVFNLFWDRSVESTSKPAILAKVTRDDDHNGQTFQIDI